MSGSVITDPVYDDANEGSLQGVISQALQQQSMNLEVMLPATVIAYDRVTNFASVQPAINMVASGGSTIPRQPIASVKVITIGGGGFVLTFPLPAGAKGWIKACDRDISLYLQTGGQTHPPSKRFHSFSDGVFIPDFSSFTIAGEDTEHATLQNQAGTIRIALWADRIKLTSPRFDVDSADINFTSSPHIGPLPP